MSSRWLSLCTALLSVVFGACGNYSNDDLDFQLALPEQGDMQARMQLSVARADSAEYYRDTRTAVTTFNDLVGKLTAIIDLVRGQTPTGRSGDERTWGPWVMDEQPSWEMRVVMQRTALTATALQMDYWVQLRPVASGDAGWVPFLIGVYVSDGGVQSGQGEIHLLVNEVRAAGYPIDQDPGLAGIVSIDVAYGNLGYPITVELGISKQNGSVIETGHYAYSEQQDGSGFMSFDWQGLSDNGLPIAARMLAQWIGSGAGRADLTADLTPNQPDLSTVLGTDCWGVDSVSTYHYRLGKPDETKGDPASCLF